jgi:cell division protein FtsW (lipid II flippase)
MGPRGWWGARDDFRGGIGVGAIFAILAALITWLTARGRAANAVQRSLGVVIVVGVIALAVALLASLRHQPLVVVVPLAVAGAVFAGSGLLVRGPISRRYTAIELRKIRAMDAGAGASASPPLPTGRTAAGT